MNVELIAATPDSLSPPAAPGWMVTFADLLSLLLAFFVMMVATTSIDQPTWQHSVAPLARYFAGGDGSAPAAIILPPGLHAPRHDPNYVAAILENFIHATPGFQEASVVRGGHEIVLRVPGDTLSMTMLDDLATLIGNLDNSVAVRVVGEDNAGQSAEQAWRQVLARAGQTADALREKAGGRPIGVIGMIAAMANPAHARTEFVIDDNGAGDSR